jgi:YspA, cpYpsA-related SLOG family
VSGRADGRVRVLVTGSRAWSDSTVIEAALERLHAEHGDRLVIVHGACRYGADVLAERWARRRGVAVERWPADWARLGRRAGMVRNAAMVASRPDRCVAFIRDRSPGASHCAAAAEAAGIPTIRHERASKNGPGGRHGAGVP